MELKACLSQVQNAHPCTYRTTMCVKRKSRDSVEVVPNDLLPRELSSRSYTRITMETGALGCFHRRRRCHQRFSH